MKPKIAPIGIGDLEVLKLKLIGFEPGEIAHIETIMPFETRSREHRHLRRTEERFLEEIENTEESVHEMKTTERFEIEQQSREVQKEKTKFEAGASISAGYGPDLASCCYSSLIGLRWDQQSLYHLGLRRLSPSHPLESPWHAWMTIPNPLNFCRADSKFSQGRAA